MNTIHLSPPAYACTNEHARGEFHGTAPALLAAPKRRCAADKAARLPLKMNYKQAVTAVQLKPTFH